MRAAGRIAVVVMAVGLLASCEWLFGPTISFLGKVLEVDGSGHLEDDYTYVCENETYVFSASGGYSRTVIAYEGSGEDFDGDGLNGEGTVTDFRQQGSYTWDPDSMRLVLSVQSEADGDAPFQPLADPFTDSFDAILTEHKFLNVYRDRGTGNRYEFNEVVTYESGSGYTTDEWMEFSGGSYSYFYSTVFESGDTIDYGYQEQISGTYTLMPADVELEPGVTATMSRHPDTAEFREYPMLGSDWNAWQPQTNASNGIEPSCMAVTLLEGILIADGVEQQRSVVPR